MQKRQTIPTGSSIGTSVVIFFLLVLLGIFCWRATAVPPQLGLHTVEVGQDLIVSSVYPAGLAWTGGIRPGDTITAVNGVPVNEKAPVDIASAASVQVRAQDGDIWTVSVDLSLPDRTLAAQIVFTGIAAGFGVVACVIYALVDQTLATNLMLLSMVSAAVWFQFGMVVPYGFPWALGGIFVSSIPFVISTFLFFMSFPINRLNLRSSHILVWMSVGGGFLLLCGYVWVIFYNTADYVSLRPFLFLFFLLNIISACALILLSFLQAKPYGERVQIAVGSISLAVLGGCLPFCVFTIIPAVVKDYILSPYLTTPFLIFLPVGIGVALLGYYHHRMALVLRNTLTTLVVSSVLIISLTALFTVVALPLIGIVVTSAIVFGLLYPYLKYVTSHVFFGPQTNPLLLTGPKNMTELTSGLLILLIQHIQQNQIQIWENGVQHGRQDILDRLEALRNKTRER